MSKNDPDVPVVRIDESSKQLVEETVQPIRAKLGQPERVDYEYEAQRILARLQFSHTSKQGSWLNRAEIELSILSRQC